MPFLLKLFCILAIACFAVIGIIGLILPIIPGFLFLFLAVLLLTRVSSRFHFMFHNHPRVERWKHRWRPTKGLSAGQRLKLSLWVFAKAVVDGVESGIRKLRR